MKEPYYYEVKKIFGEHIIIRDYVVHSAFKNNKDLIVKYGEQKMRIPNHEMAAPLQLDSRKFLSKFNNKMYGIYHFKWLPK